MQRLEVSGAVRPIYGSLGVKRLSISDGSLYRYVHKQVPPSKDARSAGLEERHLTFRHPTSYI